MMIGLSLWAYITIITLGVLLVRYALNGSVGRLFWAPRLLGITGIALVLWNIVRFSHHYFH